LTAVAICGGAELRTACEVLGLQDTGSRPRLVLVDLRVADAAITQAKIIADESRLIKFDTQLRDKDRQVRADQGQQDEALALRPTLRVGRRFPARQTHFARVSQRN